MVAGEFRKEAITKIVFRCRALPVVRLKRAHEILRVVRPKAGFFCVVIKILLKRFVALARHRQIPGKNVVERWNISGTLNRSVAAQREYATTGATDISQQQLQNRRRANDLHTFRMLRPPHRVANRSGPFWAGCGGERMRDFVKKIGRNTANFLCHLRRVTGEMPF